MISESPFHPTDTVRATWWREHNGVFGSPIYIVKTIKSPLFSVQVNSNFQICIQSSLADYVLFSKRLLTVKQTLIQERAREKWLPIPCHSKSTSYAGDGYAKGPRRRRSAATSTARYCTWYRTPLLYMLVDTVPQDPRVPGTGLFILYIQ